MDQVLIHAPWLALSAADWNSHLNSVLQEVIAASDTLIELWQTPWCDDLDFGIERVIGELKVDLVIAFSGSYET